MSDHTCRVDTVPWIPGACLIGNPGLGVHVQDIPLTGQDGAPFGLPDLEPGDTGLTEVRWLVRTWPAAGVLDAREDGSFIFSGAPPGTYSFYVDAYLRGQRKGAKLVVIEYSATSTHVGITLSLT
ncbi:MAG TPA: hypothetical protein PK861_01210 [Thermomonas sp.]|nr:hypothetical protein [Thermomonas sp.]